MNADTCVLLNLWRFSVANLKLGRGNFLFYEILECFLLWCYEFVRYVPVVINLFVTYGHIN